MSFVERVIGSALRNSGQPLAATGRRLLRLLCGRMYVADLWLLWNCGSRSRDPAPIRDPVWYLASCNGYLAVRSECPVFEFLSRLKWVLFFCIPRQTLWRSYVYVLFKLWTADCCKSANMVVRVREILEETNFNLLKSKTYSMYRQL